MTLRQCDILIESTGRIMRTCLFLFLFLFVILGCESEPFQPVEAALNEYNFAKALLLLEEIHKDPSIDKRRYRELLIKALLIEGEPEKAFAEISGFEKAGGEKSGRKHETAKLMVESAKIIIRETDRIDEAFTLMDSALIRDPGLKDDIIRTLWNRSVEYFSYPGVAGYRIFKYALEIDPKILGRMRGYNLFFAKRYGDMNAVETKLEKLYRAAAGYRKRNGSPPRSFSGLAGVNGVTPADTTHNGWILSLKDENGGIQALAKVKIDNPHDIPVETIMRFP